MLLPCVFVLWIYGSLNCCLFFIYYKINLHILNVFIIDLLLGFA